MREELKNEELDQVSGGRYFINNQNKLYFQTMPNSEFQLQGATKYAAMEIMDGLIGKYATNKEYDAACVVALQQAGLI